MQCPKCSSFNIHRTSPEQCVCRDCLNIFKSEVEEVEKEFSIQKNLHNKQKKVKNKTIKIFQRSFIYTSALFLSLLVFPILVNVVLSGEKLSLVGVILVLLLFEIAAFFGAGLYTFVRYVNPHSERDLIFQKRLSFPEFLGVILGVVGGIGYLFTKQKTKKKIIILILSFLPHLIYFSCEEISTQYKVSQEFNSAIENALKASNLTQTAATVEEWSSVESLWRASLSSLHKIPKDTHDYVKAKAKIDEYTKNLEYAQSIKAKLEKEKKEVIEAKEKERLVDKQKKELEEKERYQYAQSLFDRVEKEYGFRPQIDTWGASTKGLFIPTSAWVGLTEEEEDFLLDYARNKLRVAAIVAGEVKDSETITLDIVIVCFDERVMDSCIY